jgi:DNA-binding PadR family transcriptional regulator
VHGYEVIRALEQRLHGIYSPSAGVVYPTLQWLEDLGYVTVDQREGGRKVYTITDEGRAYLEQHKSGIDEIRSRIGAMWGPEARVELRELMAEFAGLGRTLVQHGRRFSQHDPETIRRVREVITRARAEVEAILSDKPESQTPTTYL